MHARMLSSTTECREVPGATKLADAGRDGPPGELKVWREPIWEARQDNPMIVLIEGTGLFLTSFAIHVMLWRARLPRHQWRALFLVFAIVAGIAAALHIGLGLSSHGLTSPRLILTILLFGSLAVTYMILFSALEADSPTLTMIELIRQRRSNGVDEAELSAGFLEQTFPRVRLEQMLHDGLVENAGGHLRVTAQGRRVASLVLPYRRLLGRGDVAVRG